MELALQIEVMDERLEKVEIRLETIDSKADSTHNLVKDIHSIVLGNEYTKNDSILAKLGFLQNETRELKSDIQFLKDDKLKRDTNIKTYLGVATAIGVVIGWIITTLLKLAT